MEKESGRAGKEENIGEIPKWEYLFVGMTSNGKAYRPSTLNFQDIKDKK